MTVSGRERLRRNSVDESNGDAQDSVGLKCSKVSRRSGLVFTSSGAHGICKLSAYGILDNTTHDRLQDAVVKAVQGAQDAMVFDVT